MKCQTIWDDDYLIILRLKKKNLIIKAQNYANLFTICLRRRKELSLFHNNHIFSYTFLKTTEKQAAI